MSIIGIIFGKKNSPWQRIDQAGNSVDTDVSYFNDHPVYTGITDAVIDGQHMVRLPAFYYRAGKVEGGEHDDKKAVWISNKPAEGFRLHPAFMDAGATLDAFHVGKYQGTDDNGKLGSQPGLMPKTRINFPDIKASAAARNTSDITGFQLWSVYHLAAIQTLALIELGTPDARSILGDGYVNGSGVRAVDDEVVAQATWHGIVGLWGNIWQMLDGLQTDDECCYRIWDEAGNKEYVSTGAKAPDGWFGSRHHRSGGGFDLGSVFLPKKTKDTRETSKFKCYTWSWSKGAVAYHGGYCGHGSYAGLFYLNVDNASSNSNTNLGGRLAKVS